MMLKSETNLNISAATSRQRKRTSDSQVNGTNIARLVATTNTLYFFKKLFVKKKKKILPVTAFKHKDKLNRIIPLYSVKPENPAKLKSKMNKNKNAPHVGTQWVLW